MNTKLVPKGRLGVKGEAKVSYTSHTYALSYGEDRITLLAADLGQPFRLRYATFTVVATASHGSVSQEGFQAYPSGGPLNYPHFSAWME
jgi:hypothetical protein